MFFFARLPKQRCIELPIELPIEFPVELLLPIELPIEFLVGSTGPVIPLWIGSMVFALTVQETVGPLPVEHLSVRYWGSCANKCWRSQVSTST